MNKFIAVLSLLFISSVVQAQNTLNIMQKDDNLAYGKWNYINDEDNTMKNEIAGRLDDNKNKNGMALFYTNITYKKVGLDDIKYPVIGLISQKEICKVCSVEFKFKDKKEKFIITSAEHGTYKVNNTLKFNKMFKEAQSVEFTLPKLGSYKFNYDNLNFDMQSGNWMKFNHEEKDLGLKMTIYNLESEDGTGTLSLATSDTLKTFTIRTVEQDKCKEECKINVSFDNIKKVYSVFNYEDGMIVSNDNTEEFQKLLDKANTVKISINGIKNAKVHVFDNSIKDYQ